MFVNISAYLVLTIIGETVPEFPSKIFVGRINPFEFEKGHFTLANTKSTNQQTKGSTILCQKTSLRVRELYSTIRQKKSIKFRYFILSSSFIFINATI